MALSMSANELVARITLTGFSLWYLLKVSKNAWVTLSPRDRIIASASSIKMMAPFLLAALKPASIAVADEDSETLRLWTGLLARLPIP